MAHTLPSNSATLAPSHLEVDPITKPQSREPYLVGRPTTGELPLPESPESIGVPNTVDDVNVEALVKSKSIGDRIRGLRLKRSMGLVELGKRTGMSASFLSQLETGRVVPTLRNLARVAVAFNKDLSFFFQDEKKNQFKTSRAKDRVRLPMGDKGSPIYISESMSALIPDRSVVPCVAEFLPNTQNSSFHPTTFQGQEFVYVIRGSLTLITENGQQELDVADVVWIDGSTKRQYRCTDNRAAKAMFITFVKKD